MLLGQVPCIGIQCQAAFGKERKGLDFGIVWDRSLTSGKRLSVDQEKGRKTTYEAIPSDTGHEKWKKRRKTKYSRFGH